MLGLRASAATVVFIPSVNNSNLVLSYILARTDRPREHLMAAKLGKGTSESPNFPHKFSSEFRVGNIRRAGALLQSRRAAGPQGRGRRRRRGAGTECPAA